MVGVCVDEGSVSLGSQPRMNGFSSIIVWGDGRAVCGWGCFRRKGDRGSYWGHRTCFLHPLQGSGVILFCIHLTAASDKVGNPGLIKMSEF